MSMQANRNSWEVEVSDLSKGIDKLLASEIWDSDCEAPKLETVIAEYPLIK